MTREVLCLYVLNVSLMSFVTAAVRHTGWYGITKAIRRVCGASKTGPVMASCAASLQIVESLRFGLNAKHSFIWAADINSLEYISKCSPGRLEISWNCDVLQKRMHL